MSAASDTSWGERWLDAAGASEHAGVAERLARGRYYASRGGGSDLTVSRGELSARVPEGRLRPRLATIEVPVLEGDDRAALLDVLASEVRFLAAVLEGGLPPSLADALSERELQLVPDRAEMVEACTCGDLPMPCRHIATIHHAFADRLDEDPLPLLQLRGQDPTSLLAALRERRRGGAPPEGTVPVSELDVTDLTDARGELAAVSLQPRRAEDPAWLFSHLGAPPGVDDPRPLEESLARAADFAWRIAAGEGSDVADEELLLAELRAQRTAAAGSVAEALGWDVEQTRELLDHLFESGRVLRMGAGEDARYRAAG